MKKLIQIAIVTSSLGFSNAFAGAPTEDIVKNNSSYNSPDDAVKFSAQKGTGQVKLQVTIKDLNAYNKVIIEKSATGYNEFTEVKSISCADQLKYGGATINQADKYSASSKDVFYRVKTITNDGIERMYAPVLVPAATK